MSEASSEKLPLEIIPTDSERVACDGGGGVLGHPRVWLHLGDDESIVCPYCSRLYVIEESPS